MTLTWRGLGYLGFMIPLAFWAIACAIGGVNNFNAMRIAFVVAAIAVWVVGSKLNAEGECEDGQAPHLTFGQPMQYSVWVSGACLVLTFM